MTAVRASAAAELIAEAIHTYGIAQFRVLGSSMRPLLRSGDVVQVERESLGGMNRGEVAVFARGGGLFAHRVIGLTQASNSPALVTKGDAFPHADEPVTRGELLGRVTGIVRNGRRIAFDSAQQRALGRVVAAVSAAAPVWYPTARAMKRAIRAMLGATAPRNAGAASR